MNPNPDHKQHEQGREEEFGGKIKNEKMIDFLNLNSTEIAHHINSYGAEFIGQIELSNFLKKLRANELFWFCRQIKDKSNLKQLLNKIIPSLGPDSMNDLVKENLAYFLEQLEKVAYMPPGYQLTKEELKKDPVLYDLRLGYDSLQGFLQGSTSDIDTIEKYLKDFYAAKILSGLETLKKLDSADVIKQINPEGIRKYYTAKYKKLVELLRYYEKRTIKIEDPLTLVDKIFGARLESDHSKTARLFGARQIFQSILKNKSLPDRACLDLFPDSTQPFFRGPSELNKLYEEAEEMQKNAVFQKFFSNAENEQIVEKIFF